ncbi:ubiquitin-conjugating enzyme/RWD-like protein [Apiospora phragmitis]|uniref:Ubiquitin-conjugating enzyme/RWD-like protein n=1 Tax=Apiospora phragmitis TaxID=2905665 RepID=A0ABR1X6S9_9PEZI
MASSKFNSLPALRKQNLLVEFSGLKQSCPEGIFVSLTPGDPALWSGVVFVRDGPYAPAVMRFQISFPDAYPRLPPLVTFSTDMFHPLITPLTTYMYSTDVQDHNATVSATDEERLPPGGFSLRHGFPDWFGRRSRSRAASSQVQQTTPPRQPPKSSSSSGGAGGGGTPGSRASAVGESPGFADTRKTDISTFEVLRYIRSTFDDEAVLDAIPLEAAGNPGAWHSWRTHRQDSGKAFHTNNTNNTTTSPPPPQQQQQPVGEGEGRRCRRRYQRKTTCLRLRRPRPPPGEWNWEGVWEARVKKGVDASVSEAVLYGGTGAGDDVIRFLSMEEGDVEAVKENLLRTLEHTASV